MFNKHMNNDKGFTLIELLATLAISSVVVLLITSIIITTSHNKDKLQSDSELQRQTNILVADMRKNYYENTGVSDLTYRINPTIEVQSLKINGSLVQPDTPIQDIDFDNALHLEITTVNHKDKMLTINTTWRPTHHPRTIFLDE